MQKSIRPWLLFLPLLCAAPAVADDSADRAARVAQTMRKAMQSDTRARFYNLCIDECSGKTATCAREWPRMDLDKLTTELTGEGPTPYVFKVRAFKVDGARGTCIGYVEAVEKDQTSKGLDHRPAIFHLAYDLDSGLKGANNVSEEATEAQVEAALADREAARAADSAQAQAPATASPAAPSAARAGPTQADRDAVDAEFPVRPPPTRLPFPFHVDPKPTATQ